MSRAQSMSKVTRQTHPAHSVDELALGGRRGRGYPFGKVDGIEVAAVAKETADAFDIGDEALIEPSAEPSSASASSAARQARTPNAPIHRLARAARADVMA